MIMKKLRGKMKYDLQLLSTDLKLKKGQEVFLSPADNLPKKHINQYFARPVRLIGIWKKASKDDSILIDADEVILIK